MGKTLFLSISFLSELLAIWDKQWQSDRDSLPVVRLVVGHYSTASDADGYVACVFIDTASGRDLSTERRSCRIVATCLFCLSDGVFTYERFSAVSDAAARRGR